VRECVAHYEPILPRPIEEQYMAITQALLAKYPCLKDRGTCYWVSIYVACDSKCWSIENPAVAGAYLEYFVGK